MKRSTKYHRAKVPAPVSIAKISKKVIVHAAYGEYFVRWLLRRFQGYINEVLAENERLKIKLQAIRVIVEDE